MKILSLCAAAFLLLTPAHGQDHSRMDPHERLGRLVGEYEIAGRIWASPAAEPRTISGTARWTRSHDGTQLHEHFTLEVGGRQLTGDAWIAWRPDAQRYELTQLDDFSSTSFWLVGSWDEERERISLHDLEETRAAGRPAMRWEYHEVPEGFVKEIYRSDGEGGWVLMSDYRYTTPDDPGPRTTEIPGVVEVPMEEGFRWVVVEIWSS